MIFKFPKKIFYHILYALCIGIPYLGDFEITFFVWSVTAVVTLQNRYSFVFLRYLAGFVFIVVFAFFMGVFHIKDLFYFVRDITYIAKPIVGLLIGYQICRHNFSRFFKIIVYVGVGIAVIHLLIIAKTVLQLKTVDVHRLREFSGYFSDYEVYTLIILVFYKRFGLTFSSQKVYIFSVLLAISIFLYLARINFIQFVVLYLGMKGIYEINRRSMTKLALIVLTIGLGYTAIYYSNPKRNGKGIEALLFKIKNAPQESFKTKINRDNYKEFNDNYRSYEIISTIRQVTHDGTNTILFGRGLGSTIDLKQKVWLGDKHLRYIYVLHNAYMTTFLKSGLLGVIVLLFSIVLLFRQKRSGIEVSNQVALLLIGSSVFLVMSNWVLMGYYFTNDTKSILIGSLICYRELLEKKHRSDAAKQKLLA